MVPRGGKYSREKRGAKECKLPRALNDLVEQIDFLGFAVKGGIPCPSENQAGNRNPFVLDDSCHHADCLLLARSFFERPFRFSASAGEVCPIYAGERLIRGILLCFIFRRIPDWPECDQGTRRPCGKDSWGELRKDNVVSLEPTIPPQGHSQRSAAIINRIAVSQMRPSGYEQRAQRDKQGHHKARHWEYQFL